MAQTSLALLLLLAGFVFFLAPAGAQAPPSSPHQFFGSAADGSGAVLNTQPAPDGMVVTAISEAGVVVGTSTIDGGLWLIQIGADEAASVTFSIGESDPSSPFAVESGALTAVALNLMAPVPDDPPPSDAEDDRAEPLLGGLDLVPGWNEVLWVEPAQPIDQAVGVLGAQIRTVFHWLRHEQRWASWAALLPDPLNSLTGFEAGRIYWIWLEAEPELVASSSAPVSLLSTELSENSIGTAIALTWLRNSSTSFIDAVDIRYCVTTRFGESVFRYGFGSDCVRGLYQPSVPLAPGGEVLLSLTLNGYDTAGEVEATLVRVRWTSGETWP